MPAPPRTAAVLQHLTMGPRRLRNRDATVMEALAGRGLIQCKDRHVSLSRKGRKLAKSLNLSELWRVEHGDSRQLLRTLPSNHFDSIVCDPPYLIAFMQAKWDKMKGNPAADPAFWAEVLRVLKPGGHLLAFGAPRTYHRLACAIEDGGFVIRNSIHWTQGASVPAGLNISKAIDKTLGAKRPVIGKQTLTGSAAMSIKDKGGTYSGNTDSRGVSPKVIDITGPGSPEAEQWDDWHTGLRPSHECIMVAQKPTEKGLTIATNVLKWGVGGLYVGPENQGPGGRWPANFLLSHSEGCTDLTCAPGCPVEEMGHQSGRCKSAGNKKPTTGKGAFFGGTSEPHVHAVSKVNKGDDGTAARYFHCFRYCKKANRKEKDAGLPGRNSHGTVKPLELMRWLVRLATPPGGLVLDPFAGSGTTGAAVIMEGARFVGFEWKRVHAAEARARIAFWESQMRSETRAL